MKARIDTRGTPKTRPQHCGALMALDVARQSLRGSAANGKVSGYAIRENSRSLQKACEESLLRMAENNTGLRDFIHGYLGSDLERMRAQAKELTSNKWERFVLDCGCVGRNRWKQTSLQRAAQSVVEELPITGRWLISGSAAMRLHGFRVSPNDIDVWLDAKTFEMVSKKLGVQVRTAKLPHGRACRMTLERMGWKVEYTGPVMRTTGPEMTVDAEMLLRANRYVQAVEDLVAELLVMKRPPPKCDLDRAYALYQQFQHRIDDVYLQRRLQHWRETAASSLLLPRGVEQR